MSPAAATAIENGLAAARGWIAGELAGMAGNVAGAVTVAILSLFLTYYVLADGDSFWSRIVQSTDERHRAHVEATGWDAIERVGGYLRGTGILAGVRAIICWSCSSSSACRWPPRWPSWSSGGFIPYIGPLVATLAVLLTALATVGSTGTIDPDLRADGRRHRDPDQLLRPVIYGHQSTCIRP